MIIWYIVVWCLCNWPLSGLVSAHRARRLAAIETNLTFSCTCSFSYKQRSKLLRHFSLRWTVTIICYFLLKFHSSTGNLLRSLRHSSFRTTRFFEFWRTSSPFSCLISNLSFLDSSSLHFFKTLTPQSGAVWNIESLANIERMRGNFIKKNEDIFGFWNLKYFNHQRFWYLDIFVEHLIFLFFCFRSLLWDFWQKIGKL